MLKAVDLTAFKTSSPDKGLSDLSDSNFYDDVMTMVMLSASYAFCEGNAQINFSFFHHLSVGKFKKVEICL